MQTLKWSGLNQEILQYPPNTPKCDTSDPYWIQNNLFFDIPFYMHNNVNNIIKIFSTSYLLIPVIFPSFTSYWNHDSWVQKPQKFFHDTSKTGSTSNRHLSTTIRPLRIIFTLSPYGF